MHKKILFISLVVLLILSIIGCAQKQTALSIDLTQAKENIELLSIYGELKELPEDELKLAYGLDVEMMEESSIFFSSDLMKAPMFAIIKPKEDQIETVREQLDTFLINYENKWTLYLPEETALVQNALLEEDGDYLILIISDDNEQVLEAIQAAKN